MFHPVNHEVTRSYDLGCFDDVLIPHK